MSPTASFSVVNGYLSHTSLSHGDPRLVKGEAYSSHEDVISLDGELLPLNSETHSLTGNQHVNGHAHTSDGHSPARPAFYLHSKPTTPRFPTHVRYTSVIFDLGDVLFTWSPSSPRSPLPAKTLKKILRSATWFEYEKGRLTENEAYALVAQEFGLVASDVAGAFRAARDSLQSNPTLLEVIRDIKASGRRVFAMSNISAPDWDVLTTKADPSEWALFDRVFTSAGAHERKPNVGFYQHVLTATGIDPTRTVFVDDKVENVLTARSFGMHGIVFDDLTNVVRQLRNVCGDPIQRAQGFLAAHKKRLMSVTSSGVELRENFAQLLILEATGDRSLVDYVEYPRLFNFFQGAGVLTTEKFPNDMDTTSIGLTVSTHIDSATKHAVMDEILSYRNEDNLVQVYFDRSRPRIDPVVCVNVLTLFYRNNRGHELDATLEWVYYCLLHRAYTDGTLYYATAETFLFFLSRLMQSAPHVRERFEPVFKERVMERFGIEGDSLALAMRALAAASVGLAARADLEKLITMQQADGSWTKGWFYKYGASGLQIGNDGLTTALAINAIDAVTKLDMTGGPRVRYAECAFPAAM